MAAALSGLPAGLALDAGEAWRRALRRVPGMSEMGVEPPEWAPPETLCGVRDGRSDGGTAVFLLHTGEDVRAPGRVPRPGHGDLEALARWEDGDFSGGAYSGRLSAAVAFAGALCLEPLAALGVTVEARLADVGGERGDGLTFDMKKQLLDARGTGDSVGGAVECAAAGLPAGLGDPPFGGLSASVAALLFALPGVTGVEFGLGFGFTALRGSTANDAIVLREGRPAAETNRCGGVEAGLSTGAPLVVRAALRPTPGINREQRSVDLDLMQETGLRQRSRREPCLAPRAVPAVEGAVAFCLLDALLSPELNAGRALRKNLGR